MDVGKDISQAVMSEADELYRDFLQKSVFSVNRLPLVPVRGVPLMNLIAENFESVWNFEPDPSDLLIATYPKAGSTWTQEIIDLLLNNGDAEFCRRAPTPVRSPCLELVRPGIGTDGISSNAPVAPLSGVDLVAKLDPPRVIKTHLPFQLVPPGFWEKKCKTIYVARNAKDNLVSYFFFDQMNKAQPEPGPWDGYIRKFMRGELSWGSWYDHVTGFWNERLDKNILFLFYEDIKENPRREIERIIRYLDLSLSDDVITRIMELTSFKSMKENPMANYTFIPRDLFDVNVSPFMRKGEVGDWQNHFTPEQAKEFDEDYERKMKDVDIPFRNLI